METPETGEPREFTEKLAEYSPEQLDELHALTDEEIIREGLTYGDVNIRVEESDVREATLDKTSRLTKKIELNLPLVSAAMDKVTEHEMAIALARQGGVGVIHKNLDPEPQAAEVERVKRASSALIREPIQLPPEATVATFMEIREERGIGSVMVVEDGKLVGMMTKRQLRLLGSSDRAKESHQRLEGLMLPLDQLVTVPAGATQEDAEAEFRKRENAERNIDFIPAVDSQGRLAGLYTFKDIWERSKYPNAAKAADGRLLVGAAVGIGPDLEERLERLVAAEVDFVTIDNAHGYDLVGLNLVEWTKQRYPELDVIAGNFATAKGVAAAIERGADAVKVGVGPGAICTTRKVAGVGAAQLAAIKLATGASRGEVPIIADGGITQYGDIGKALVAGAESVMVGSMLAGTEESPGETVLIEGRPYKEYRGMGSEGAIREGSGSRYFTADEESDIVPEGIEGAVPYKGPLRRTTRQFAGSIEKAMFYTGSTTVPQLRERGRFVRVSPAAQNEGEVHDVRVTKEPVNYSTRS